MKKKPGIFFLRYFVLNPPHGLVFYFEVPVLTNVLRVSQWYNLLLPWWIPSPYRTVSDSMIPQWILVCLSSAFQYDYMRMLK